MSKAIFWVSIVIAFCSASPAPAQVDSTNVKTIVEQLIELEKTTQKEQDAWASERAEMQARVAALKATVAFLKDRKTADETKLADLDRGLADIEQRIARSSSFEDSLRSTLMLLCDELDPVVRGDLPFRVADRQSRLDGLRTDIQRSDILPADKVSKLFDILQSEAAYGVTVEVADERVAVGSDTLIARVLRVGRVALFWRAGEGDRAGRFDRETGTWIELPAKYSGKIKRAIEMASRECPIDVIALPIGRIKP